MVQINPQNFLTKLKKKSKLLVYIAVVEIWKHVNLIFQSFQIHKISKNNFTYSFIFQ